jgi:hypothetical protein
MQEPARLWRRYFLEDMPVFTRMLMEPLETTAPALPRGTYRTAPVAITNPSYDAGMQGIGS